MELVFGNGQQTTITIRTLTEAARLLLEEKALKSKELILVHEPRLEYWADNSNGNDEEILQNLRDQRPGVVLMVLNK